MNLDRQQMPRISYNNICHVIVTALSLWLSPSS